MISTRLHRVCAVGAQRIRLLATPEYDSGMSTAEYAVGTIAAAAFATILYAVVTGTPVVSALGSLVTKALSVKL